MKNTNVDQLVDAGLLEGTLTDEQKDIINELSDQEIKAVIKAGKKLKATMPAGAPKLYMGF